jgi:type IV pilus assembly protein PilY1
MDVTDIEVFEGGDALSGFSGTFGDLAAEIQENRAGWRMDFRYMAGERNLGEPVLAGDVLTFTTYVPSDEPCSIGGESQVYALYYTTGTAFTHSIIGLDYTNMSGDNPLVLKHISLGMGMTITPNIHVGREKGSRAYIQTSTGAIKPLEQSNPGDIKSGRVATDPSLDLTCP